MAKYDWESDRSRLLRMLRASAAQKQKRGWSREIGAGFIVEDIIDIETTLSKKLLFHFSWGDQAITPRDLNLRETEEAIKFLEA
jgi:hypothetical protein